MDELKGKVALVMGIGKKRAGNHIAHMLADLGVNIAIHYNLSKKEAKILKSQLLKKGIETEMFYADIANSEDISNLVQSVVDRFKSIDILINSAGAYRSTELNKIGNDDDFNFFYEINTRGSGLTALHVGHQMLTQEDGGVIVNIADWAMVKPNSKLMPEIALKGAIPSLTKSLALEFAPKVRANYIIPGPIMLPRNMPEAERKEIISKTILKKEGSPSNIALAALHFILNDFVTGDGCIVDGGTHIKS